MPAITRRLARAAVPLVVALGLVAVVEPAQAADTGSISGLVTAKPAGGSAAPYAEATVVVDRLDEDGFTLDTHSAQSGSNGRFAVSGLPDGSYQIRTYPEDHRQFAHLGDLGYEYYDDRWAPGRTTLITVSGGAAVTVPKTIELQPIGHVVGRVTNEQGEPVPATIGFTSVDGGSGYGFSVDADGSYDSLDGEWSDNLIPGRYEVRAAVEWDHSGPGFPEYAPAATTVTVTPGGTVTANLTLVERPAVDFTVLGSDGEPQAYAPVGFWMRDAGESTWRSPQYGPITTDENGRFRLTDTADEYKIRFQAAEDGGQGATEYWKGAYSFADASVVSFAGDVPMSREYTVRLGAEPTIRPGTPSVSGTVAVGQTITLDPGTWAPSGVTTRIEWYAADKQVGTGSRLLITPDLEGKYLWARVTGSKAGLPSVDTEKSDVGVVAAGTWPPTVTAGEPSVSGKALAGKKLTADAGAWEPAGVVPGYQWLADGTAISGETGPNLRLTNALAGRRISVRVSGTLPGADVEPVVATSAETAPVVGELATKRPVLTGTTRVGKSLKATVKAWGPGSVKLSWQWRRDGQVVKGRTGTTYRLTKADAGHKITVRVTGKKASYATASQTSKPTAKIRR